MNMVTIEVREVSDHLYRTLADNARDRGQTLQQYLLAMLVEAGERLRANDRANRRASGEQA
jgi:hypothetical protein